MSTDRTHDNSTSSSSRTSSCSGASYSSDHHQPEINIRMKRGDASAQDTRRYMATRELDPRVQEPSFTKTSSVMVTRDPPGIVSDDLPRKPSRSARFKQSMQRRGSLSKLTSSFLFRCMISNDENFEEEDSDCSESDSCMDYYSTPTGGNGGKAAAAAQPIKKKTVSKGARRGSMVTSLNNAFRQMAEEKTRKKK